MGTNQRRSLLPLLALVAIVAAMGCSTKIGNLTNEPDRYNEQRVVVKGTVTKTFALPLLGQSLVRLDDGTGQVWVKPHGRVPFKGEKIKVKGTLKIGMVVADHNLGVVIYQSGAD
jgi:hypothetical protein